MGKKNTETSLNPCHLSRRAHCVLSHFRGLLACLLFPAQLSKMNHGCVNAQALPGSPAATFLIENLWAHSGRRGKLKNMKVQTPAPECKGTQGPAFVKK